ncbi:MAG: alpha/beta hydrolase [Clostridiales bacterium]|jgi:pimeloyl-ACP methyl ester carboxylesterase|nr:alpha/beta hydrolase [Clostridiales bacterium]
MNLTKRKIKIENGETVAYIDAGEGAPLILLHGNMSSSAYFKPLFERLAGYRLIAPDLRGMGDSSYERRFDSFKELAEDIKQFADALNISRAHVAAWSAGGAAALELAAAYPMLVKSLFLIESASLRGFPVFPRKADGTYDPTPYKEKEGLRTDPVIGPCITAFESQNRAFISQLLELLIYPPPRPSESDCALYIDEMLKQRNLIDLDWALAVLNMSDEPNAYRAGDGGYKKVKCPIALTTAPLDMIVPRAMVEENLRAFPRAKLIEYEGCAHAPVFFCPDRLAEDIRAFLADCEYNSLR